jgi:hypothetical protein
MSYPYFNDTFRFDVNCPNDETHGFSANALDNPWEKFTYCPYCKATLIKKYHCVGCGMEYDKKEDAENHPCRCEKHSTEQRFGCRKCNLADLERHVEKIKNELKNELKNGV